MSHARKPQLIQRVWATLREALREEERDYTQGSLSRGVLLLAIPMMLEMAMESVFALADIFFVSRLGVVEVAVVGITESFLMLVYALAIGIGVAATAAVSRRIGEKDPERAASDGAQAIWLGSLVSILLGVMGGWLPEQFLTLMGADAVTAATGTPYARIIMASNVVVTLLFVNNAVLRGAGDASVAMRALWLGNGLNVVLDPCLIFGLGPFPQLGLAGAGVATVIGRGTAVVYQFIRLSRPTGNVQLVWRHYRLRSASLWEMCRLAAGGVTQYLVETTSWILIVRIVAMYGSVAVAGYIIGIRILIFALMPAWGLANAAATLVGQNLGARQPWRAERSVYLAGTYNMVFLGVVSVACLLWADALVAWFADDSEVRHIASRCLRIISTGYLFYAWQMVLVAAFNGASDTRTPATINLVCFWGIKLPLAYVLAEWLHTRQDGVFYAVAVAYSLAAVMAWCLFRRGTWKTAQLRA